MPAPASESGTPLLKGIECLSLIGPEKMFGTSDVFDQNHGNEAGRRQIGWWQRRQSMPKQHHLNVWQIASGATLGNNNGCGTAGFGADNHCASEYESTSSWPTKHQINSKMAEHGHQAAAAAASKDDRVRVGTANTTVAVLQGPHNHAIWKARLLCALKAEDEQIYAAASGSLRLERKRDGHDVESGGGGMDRAGSSDMQTGDELDRSKHIHARAIAMITSTLPDETFALVVGQNADAFKLMEALDARFRPYPRYPGI